MSSTDKQLHDRRQQDRPVPDDRRRADRRTSPRLDLELWMEELSRDAVYYRCAANVGEGGVYFDHALPYVMGTVVTLRFTLPGDDQPIVARGEVVSGPRGAVGMGLRFVGFDGDGEARLRDFVEQLAE